MKRLAITVAQAVIILGGAGVLAALILLPTTEGRAEGLDLLSIYLDPFILYGYASSIAFFTSLYLAVRVLGYARQDALATPQSLRDLKRLKVSTLIFCGLVVLAGGYIRMFHDKADDPAGFLALCMVVIIASAAVAFGVGVLQRSLQKRLTGA